MSIKWVGKVADPAEYQRGNVPENAKEIEMPATVSKLLTAALPFIIPSFAVLFFSMFLKTAASRTAVVAVVQPLFIFIGVIIGFALLLPHELLHGIVYPKEADVKIGIMPTQLAAVALASYPLSRGRFVVMSLLPFALGIIPLLGFLLSPASWLQLNGVLFGMSCMGMTSPYPDLYNVFKVLKAAPRGAKIRFVQNGLFWYKD